MTDNVPTHTVKMGQLVVNMQSLEFALRAFLYNNEKEWKKTDTEPEFLKKIKEGDMVPENAFTNYDTLGKLIDKYNQIIKPTHSALCVDVDIQHLRDALAHGRVASKSPSPEVPQELVKYSNPKYGPIKVTHCLILDGQWFNEQIKRTYTNINKVYQSVQIFEKQT